MRAADVMTFGAASIQPSAPLEEAARVMLQHRVSGLPVVDASGSLVGMVTEGDLLRHQRGHAHLANVGDVMTSPAVTIGEDMPVPEVVEILQRHAIKRVPVVKDGKVIGIVSRADLLRGLARLAQDMPAASPEDRALRQRVLDALAQERRDGWRSVNVIVHKGSVELRGATADAALRQRLVAAVHGVPGVTELNDRMVVVGPASGRT